MCICLKRVCMHVSVCYVVCAYLRQEGFITKKNKAKKAKVRNQPPSTLHVNEIWLWCLCSSYKKCFDFFLFYVWLVKQFCKTGFKICFSGDSERPIIDYSVLVSHRGMSCYSSCSGVLRKREVQHWPACLYKQWDTCNSNVML